MEVRELFSATPARLKFLKSERAENMAVSEVVKRLAMANPTVAFALTTGERTGLKLPAQPLGSDGHLARLGRIMGREFLDDALPVDIAREGVRVTGFAGLPTLNRPDPGQQYLFVNGRPVKDKLLIGAVRAAYGDLVPKGRYPLLALFVDLSPREVDVNVHPSKAEVRFRDGRRRAQPGGRRAAGGAGGGGAQRHGRRRPADARRAGAVDGRRLGGEFQSRRSHARAARSAGPGFAGGVPGGLAGAAGRVGGARAPTARQRPSRCAAELLDQAAGGGAGAAARDLHRGADAHTPSSSSTSTPRTSAWSTSASRERSPTAAWRGRPC